MNINPDNWFLFLFSVIDLIEWRIESLEYACF